MNHIQRTGVTRAGTWTRARRLGRSLAGIGLVLALTGAAAPASAAGGKKRVVLLPFSGPKGAAVRKGVIQGLGKAVWFKTSKEFIAEGNAQGVDPFTAEGMSRICSRLEVDAVITGAVNKRRYGKYSISLKLFDGGSGKVVAKRGASARGARGLSGAGRTLGKRLKPLLRKCAFDASGAGAQAAAPAPQEPAPAPVVDKPLFEPVAPARPVVTARASRPGRFDGLLEFSAGMGFSIRRYELKGADASEDRLYNGDPFPEFTVRLDLYPLTPAVRGFVRNLGLGGSYSRHVSVTTSFVDSQGASVDVETSSQEMIVDALVRWILLAREASPVLLFRAGGGLRDFDLASNEVITSLNYRFLRFGVDGTIPLATPLAALRVGGDFRPILTVGQEAVDAFGYKSSAYGFSIRGGISGRLWFGLTYQAIFEYLGFANEFNGRPDAPANHAPVVRTDAAKAKDRFMGLNVSVGYAL